MSLKAFHLVFIIASIVLSFVVGAWGMQQYRLQESATGLMLAIGFYITGVLLVIYAIRFVRKVRELGI